MFRTKIKSESRLNQRAFTIVELLIVVVVIAILAAITLVTYNGFQNRAEEAVIKSDLTQAAKQLGLDKAISDKFPSAHTAANNNQGLLSSEGVAYEYDSDGQTFCLSAVRGDKAYHITQNGNPEEGVCSGHSGPIESGGGATITDGSPMQSITRDNCPTERTRAVDARDSRTYWVQKLADSKCWMLTNLAYAGGGANTHNDSKSLVNGTGGSATYTAAQYYIPSGANPSTEPSLPSSSVNGTGQYGYLYNWCAAMGGQTTAACANATAPSSNANISVCPSGWRLPTGNAGELTALNAAINSSSTSSGTGLLTAWLGQYGGYWSNGFWTRGLYGHYWSSTPQSATSSYSLYFGSNFVNPSSLSSKTDAKAVRCLAS